MCCARLRAVIRSLVERRVQLPVTLRTPVESPHSEYENNLVFWNDLEHYPKGGSRRIRRSLPRDSPRVSGFTCSKSSIRFAAKVTALRQALVSKCLPTGLAHSASSERQKSWLLQVAQMSQHLRRRVALVLLLRAR